MQQQPMQPGAPPAQGGGFASYAPKSKPGTLFGIPLSTLRDQSFERKALIICGLVFAGGKLNTMDTNPTVL
jgi:hypothetical protein